MRSTEYGLGPDGQIAGLVPVDGVVARAGLGDLEVTGQGVLDLAIVGRRPDVKVAQRDVEAPAVEADVQDGPSFGSSAMIASPAPPCCWDTRR